MAYSKYVFKIATEKLNDRRTSALNMADFRKNEVYSAIPRLKEIDSELASVGASTGKAVLSGGDTKALLTSLKEKSAELQQEYEQLLISNGYSADYLEPQYACEKCNDTGYIEADNKTLVCDCYKKLMSESACEELNKISPLSLSTFDSFNLDYYSDSPDEKGNIPYKRMTKIYSHCLNYAKTFSVNSKGLLLIGGTGLGKTHLSLAIANEVINCGYSVVYVSAPDILSRLEKEHFSYDYDKEQILLQSLLDCDLLILDDLGTEFSTQFTNSAIYNLFNTRVNMGKPIIINTNLDVNELANLYTKRFTSRLLNSCEQLDFIGKDIRAII
ncbi:MAG: ATP-binding protein [Ruminococcus sp.]|nr:ATP-binding protein [Ruminococcus sp.]